MRRLLGSRLSVAVVASVVTAVVVGGVAWAVQSPVDGNGVIHACYNPTTGAVQLDVVGTCPKKGNTTPITWNAQGPKGDPGPPGTSVTPIFAKLDLSNTQAPPGSAIPVLAGSHVVSATFVADVPVEVSVTFDRDVRLCADTTFVEGDNGGSVAPFAAVTGLSGASMTLVLSGGVPDHAALDVFATCAS
jgi:hypothetical protein